MSLSDTFLTTGARADLMQRVARELDRAYEKHGRAPWSRHEFYAILAEEVEELWGAIKHDEPREQMEAELVQVAAMCFRYYETTPRGGAAGCWSETVRANMVRAFRDLVPLLDEAGAARLRRYAEQVAAGHEAEEIARLRAEVAQQKEQIAALEMNLRHA